jgi:hypothetical protein
MRHILTGLLLIGLLSCNHKQVNKDLDRPFIKSYKELDQNCVNIFISLLKPYESWKDTLINKVYKLDVFLDSSIYSQDDLRYNYFVGVKLKPDLFDLIIFNIDLKVGAITLCQILPDETLIINNTEYLFTDLTSLRQCGGLNIADSLLKYTSNDKTMFRYIAWTNKLYGKWQLDTSKKGFENDQFNNMWNFIPDKGFVLTNSRNKSILTDSIDLQGNILKIIKSGYEFEIATLTKKKILIKEKGTDNYIVLIKTEFE